MLPKIQIIMVCLIVAGTAGCSLFSGKTDEVVLAATEVGTPQGERITKEIGPAGGTLSSQDGRLTVTVPPNAVTENVAFSVQSISNKAEDGVGLAYRLEPRGKTFKTPLQLSIRYNEEDVAGTYPQALRLAYQDEKGAWHEQGSTAMDTVNNQITVSTTHLSDWSMNYGTAYRVIPGKAVVYVGQSVEIRTWKCEYIMFAYWFQKKKPCSGILGEFTLKGSGTLTPSTVGPTRIVYTAPAKKPTPNVVTVGFRINYGDFWHAEDMRYLETKITILDHAYRATGHHGALELSGVICSLDQPFSIHGTIMGYPMNYIFNFTPSSSSAGTVDIAGSGYLVTAKGSGTYTIEGRDSDKPRIAMTATTTGHIPVGSATGKGTGDFVELVPLDTNECSEPPPPPPPPPPRPNPDMRGRKYKSL